MKRGDKVTVPYWGTIREGEFSRIGREGTTSTLVWVVFKGETRERWFHPGSVTPK